MSIRRHQLARSQSRRIALASPVPQECAVCGYSKHVAVCHIKPVHSFKDGTPAHKINSLSNLCYLCPNCHWSFDHDMLNTVPPSLAELERGGPFPMKRIKVKPVEDGLALIRRMPYGVRRIR